MRAEHLEILIEDQSGRTLIEGLLPKILPDSVTFRIHHYRGIGHIPRNLQPKTGAARRILLDQLPRLLRGYSRGRAASQAVVGVLDADDRDCAGFLAKLHSIAETCQAGDFTLFRLAIEETEAWLLGDHAALMQCFPKAKQAVLRKYTQDSVCGTWEALADAIHPGGSAKLKQSGSQAVGLAKKNWAAAMAPRMEIGRNRSPSFQSSSAACAA